MDLTPLEVIETAVAYCVAGAITLTIVGLTLWVLWLLGLV